MARHITKEYQIVAFVQLTAIDESAISSLENRTQFLYCWLLEKSTKEIIETNHFIDYLSNYTQKETPKTKKFENDAKFHVDTLPYYYGNEGKRQGVARFFLDILQSKEPQTLLLFSDENMDWMYEDTDFAKHWSNLFCETLRLGNRVKIIHTVNRDSHSMMEAMTMWFSAYMTGSIEPYYYPRLRDCLFQRTMLIAPKSGALISTSVKHETENMLNLYITDKKAISSLILEYNQLLSQCKPLMRIFTKNNHASFIENFLILNHVPQNMTVSHGIPSLFSMPETLAKEISETNHCPVFYETWKDSVRAFHKNIENHHITEIILSPKEAVKHLDTIRLPIVEMILQKILFIQKNNTAHI